MSSTPDELASRLISVTQAAELSGLTTSYIRRLMRNGEMQGVKVGRNWLTTEDAVREYLRKERKPGRKAG